MSQHGQEGLLGLAPENGDLFESLGRLEMDRGLAESYEAFCLPERVSLGIVGGDEQVLIDASHGQGDLADAVYLKGSYGSDGCAELLGA